jgi:hypothetical protein
MAVLAVTTLAAACRDDRAHFIMAQVDRKIFGSSAYPLALDPRLVGTYPSETKSGAGYFYDDVLEYRGWLHPERGALPLNGSHDYFWAFAIRQLESINEPEPNHYVHVKEPRITEWQVRWLAGNKRTATSIEDFLRHPHPAETEDSDSDDQ